MPLPEIIHQAHDMAIQNGGETDESQFYPLYTLLLSNFFPPVEGYMVAPQYKKPEHAKSGCPDFTIIFVVKRNYHPVFFLEVKPSGCMRNVSSREQADLQMRHRFENLFENVEIDNLYGASAIGTKICMYKLDKASRQVSPAPIASEEWVTDTAPKDRWNIDIMTPEGEEECRRVVQQVKEMSLRLCRYYLILCSRLLLIVLGFNLEGRLQSTQRVWHKLAEGVRRRRDGGSG